MERCGEVEPVVLLTVVRSLPLQVQGAILPDAVRLVSFEGLGRVVYTPVSFSDVRNSDMIHLASYVSDDNLF